MDKLKTIGFVSLYDPINDRKGWSGTIFKLREAIENSGFNVLWIPYRRPKWLMLCMGILYKLAPGNSHPLHNRFYFKHIAATVDQNLFNKCDYIFFAGATQMAPYLKISKPIIYFSDATYHQLSGYYWTKVNKILEKEGNKCEAKALEYTTVKISSSDWAANDASTFYGFPRERNHVIEFGPNIDISDIKQNKEYDGSQLNILFSGVDWERKGGDIAVETTKYLNEKGIKAKLFICGIKALPKKYWNLNYIENLGFLNKNNPIEYKKYIDTLSHTHLLLLPTRAECSAIVFSESCAFGLPVFTFDTGGISNYIVNDYNGYRLPLEAKGKEFSEKIYEIVTKNKLNTLRSNSLKIFETKLNWNRWAKEFRRIIDSL